MDISMDISMDLSMDIHIHGNPDEERLTVEHLMYSHPALVSTFCSDYARFINEIHVMTTCMYILVHVLYVHLIKTSLVLSNANILFFLLYIFNTSRQ